MAGSTNIDRMYVLSATVKGGAQVTDITERIERFNKASSQSTVTTHTHQFKSTGITGISAQAKRAGKDLAAVTEGMVEVDSLAERARAKATLSKQRRARAGRLVFSREVQVRADRALAKALEEQYGDAWRQLVERAGITSAQRSATGKAELSRRAAKWLGIYGEHVERQLEFATSGGKVGAFTGFRGGRGTTASGVLPFKSLISKIIPAIRDAQLDRTPYTPKEIAAQRSASGRSIKTRLYKEGKLEVRVAESEKTAIKILDAWQNLKRTIERPSATQESIGKAAIGLATTLGEVEATAQQSMRTKGTAAWDLLKGLDVKARKMVANILRNDPAVLRSIASPELQQAILQKYGEGPSKAEIAAAKDKLEPYENLRRRILAMKGGLRKAKLLPTKYSRKTPTGQQQTYEHLLSEMGLIQAQTVSAAEALEIINRFRENLLKDVKGVRSGARKRAFTSLINRLNRMENSLKLTKSVSGVTLGGGFGALQSLYEQATQFVKSGRARELGQRLPLGKYVFGKAEPPNAFNNQITALINKLEAGGLYAPGRKVAGRSRPALLQDLAELSLGQTTSTDALALLQGIRGSIRRAQGGTSGTKLTALRGANLVVGNLIKEVQGMGEISVSALDQWRFIFAQGKARVATALKAATEATRYGMYQLTQLPATLATTLKGGPAVYTPFGQRPPGLIQRIRAKLGPRPSPIQFPMGLAGPEYAPGKPMEEPGMLERARYRLRKFFTRPSPSGLRPFGQEPTVPANIYSLLDRFPKPKMPAFVGKFASFFQRPTPPRYTPFGQEPPIPANIYSILDKIKVPDFVGRFAEFFKRPVPPRYTPFGQKPPEPANIYSLLAKLPRPDISGGIDKFASFFRRPVPAQYTPFGQQPPVPTNIFSLLAGMGIPTQLPKLPKMPNIFARLRGLFQRTPAETIIPEIEARIPVTGKGTILPESPYDIESLVGKDISELWGGARIGVGTQEYTTKTGKKARRKRTIPYEQFLKSNLSTIFLSAEKMGLLKEGAGGLTREELLGGDVVKMTRAQAAAQGFFSPEEIARAPKLYQAGTKAGDEEISVLRSLGGYAKRALEGSTTFGEVNKVVTDIADKLGGRTKKLSSARFDRSIGMLEDRVRQYDDLINSVTSPTGPLKKSIDQAKRKRTKTKDAIKRLKEKRREVVSQEAGAAELANELRAFDTSHREALRAMGYPEEDIAKIEQRWAELVSIHGPQAKPVIGKAPPEEPRSMLPLPATRKGLDKRRLMRAAFRGPEKFSLELDKQFNLLADTKTGRRFSVEELEQLRTSKDEVDKKRYAAYESNLKKRDAFIQNLPEGALARAFPGENRRFRSFATALRTVAQFTGAATLVYQIAMSFRTAVGAAVQLETAMAALQGVLPTRSFSERLFIEDAVIQAARKYSLAIQEVAASAKIFAQQGLTGAAVVRELDTAMRGVRALGISPESAREALTAIRQITAAHRDDMVYQGQSFSHVASTEEMLNRIARIESRRAITAEDLSDALKAAGPFASQLGGSVHGLVDDLDLVMGSVTAIVEQTRVSGKQAATGLRFILARLGRPQVISQIQALGKVRLATEESQGKELRPLIQLLGELAGAYKRLKEESGTAEATKFLVAVAGGRQINLAAALLENYSSAIETARMGALAFGDVQARLNIQLNTLSARLQNLQNEITLVTRGFLYSATSADGFRLLIDKMTLGLRSLNKSIDSTEAKLAILAGSFFVVFNLFKGLWTAIRIGLGFETATTAVFGFAKGGQVIATYWSRAVAVIRSIPALGPLLAGTGSVLLRLLGPTGIIITGLTATLYLIGKLRNKTKDITGTFQTEWTKIGEVLKDQIPRVEEFKGLATYFGVRPDEMLRGVEAAAAATNDFIAELVVAQTTNQKFKDELAKVPSGIARAPGQYAAEVYRLTGAQEEFSKVLNGSAEAAKNVRNAFYAALSEQPGLGGVIPAIMKIRDYFEETQGSVAAHNYEVNTYLQLLASVGYVTKGVLNSNASALEASLVSVGDRIESLVPNITKKLQEIKQVFPTSEEAKWKFSFPTKIPVGGLPLFPKDWELNVPLIQVQSPKPITVTGVEDKQLRKLLEQFTRGDIKVEQLSEKLPMLMNRLAIEIGGADNALGHLLGSMLSLDALTARVVKNFEKSGAQTRIFGTAATSLQNYADALEQILDAGTGPEYENLLNQTQKLLEDAFDVGNMRTATGALQEGSTQDSFITDWWMKQLFGRPQEAGARITSATKRLFGLVREKLVAEGKITTEEAAFLESFATFQGGAMAVAASDIATALMKVQNPLYEALANFYKLNLEIQATERSSMRLGIAYEGIEERFKALTTVTKDLLGLTEKVMTLQIDKIFEAISTHTTGPTEDSIESMSEMLDQFGALTRSLRGQNVFDLQRVLGMEMNMTPLQKIAGNIVALGQLLQNLSTGEMAQNIFSAIQAFGTDFLPGAQTVLAAFQRSYLEVYSIGQAIKEIEAIEDITSEERARRVAELLKSPAGQRSVVSLENMIESLVQIRALTRDAMVARKTVLRSYEDLQKVAEAQVDAEFEIAKARISGFQTLRNVGLPAYYAISSNSKANLETVREEMRAIERRNSIQRELLETKNKERSIDYDVYMYERNLLDLDLRRERSLAVLAYAKQQILDLDKAILDQQVKYREQVISNFDERTAGLRSVLASYYELTEGNFAEKVLSPLGEAFMKRQVDVLFETLLNPATGVLSAIGKTIGGAGEYRIKIAEGGQSAAMMIFESIVSAAQVASEQFRDAIATPTWQQEAFTGRIQQLKGTERQRLFALPINARGGMVLTPAGQLGYNIPNPSILNQRVRTSGENREFDALIRAAGQSYTNVPVSLVKAIIAQESTFNPRARAFEEQYAINYLGYPYTINAQGKKELTEEGRRQAQLDPRSYAYGLGQLLLDSARGLGFSGPPEGLYDPETNIALIYKHLSRDIGESKRIAGRVDYPLATAFYNAGYTLPTRAFRAGEKFRNQDYVDWVMSRWFFTAPSMDDAGFSLGSTGTFGRPSAVAGLPFPDQFLISNLAKPVGTRSVLREPVTSLLGTGGISLGGGLVPGIIPVDIENVGTLGAEFEAAMAAAREQQLADQKKLARQQLLLSLSSLVGTQLGGAVGTAVTGNKKGSSIGAQVGTSLGALAAPLPGGAIWGPIAGGIIGGLFGSIFGGEEKQRQQLEIIARKATEQVTLLENTNKLLDLNRLSFNVPTGFTLPGYTPALTSGGAGGIALGAEYGGSRSAQGNMIIENSISVNVTGVNSEEVGQQIATTVSKHLDLQLRSTGLYSGRH